MQTMPNTEDLRSYLQSELKRRLSTRPSYSIRAFARQLGINDSTLSQILRGKRKISASMATKLASALNLDRSETEKLLKNIEAKDSRVTELKWDTFHYISEWYYDAILCLVDTKGFRPQSRWMASRLGVSVAEVNEAIERLTRLGLLEVGPDGLLKGTMGTMETEYDPDLTNSALKNYQKQLLTLSQHAVEGVAKKYRSHSSLVVGVNLSQLDEIKEKIRNFRKRLLSFIEKTSCGGEEVYGLQISFFPVTKVDKK